MLVTRGIGELTYDPAACPTPSRRRHRQAARRSAAAGLTSGASSVALVDVVRNHPDTVNPLIKSNNLLNNALAMQEALRPGAFEGVMRELSRRARRVHQSNLFIVKDGAALTPPLDAGLLPGITREFLFEMGRDGGHPRARGGAAGRRSVRRRRGVSHQHHARGRADCRVDDRTIGSGRPGPSR